MDSILHAEHKFLLEELRLDYSLTTDEKQSNDQEETERLLSSLTLLEDSTWNMRINEHVETDVNGSVECNEEDMMGSKFEKETTTSDNIPRFVLNFRSVISISRFVQFYVIQILFIYLMFCIGKMQRQTSSLVS